MTIRISLHFNAAARIGDFSIRLKSVITFKPHSLYPSVFYCSNSNPTTVNVVLYKIHLRLRFIDLFIGASHQTVS
jgi:hypothetical protein